MSTLSYSTLPSLRPIAAATAFHISYLYKNLYEDFYYISAPHMHRAEVVDTPSTTPVKYVSFSAFVLLLAPLEI